jgi:hypothetical protein
MGKSLPALPHQYDCEAIVHPHARVFIVAKLRLPTANNYWSYADQIVADPRGNISFLRAFVRHIKSDFPKAWRKTMKSQMSEALRVYDEVCNDKITNEDTTLTKTEVQKRVRQLIRKHGHITLVEESCVALGVPVGLYVPIRYNHIKAEDLFKFAYNVSGNRTCPYCKNKLPFVGLTEGYVIYCTDQCRKSFRQTKKSIDGSEMTFEEYSKEARRVTELNAKKVKGIAKRSLNQHLDHKMSIIDGFVQGVSINIIAHEANLRIIEADVNLAKGTESSITVKDLFKAAI